MLEVKVPDMGSDDAVDLVEILVKAGDQVEAEDSLVVLESAKASVEVPAPAAGTIQSINVKTGQSLQEGDLLLILDTKDEGSSEQRNDQSNNDENASTPVVQDTSEASESTSEQDSNSKNVRHFTIPDIGGEQADVIELPIAVGDRVEVEQTLAVLESAKATVEIPAAVSGTIEAFLVKVGQSVNEGNQFVSILVDTNGSTDSKSSAKTEKPKSEEPANESTSQTAGRASTNTQNAQQTQSEAKQNSPAVPSSQKSTDVNFSASVHAGPAVRRLANELGVALDQVTPSGPRDRVLKDDIHRFVKSELQSQSKQPSVVSTTGQLPSVDFSQWGEIDNQPLSKIQALSAGNLHRAWVTIPHVTQFDEADITELEAFRKQISAEYKAKNIKITLLAFLIKAVCVALSEFPRFNSSLSADGKTLVLKKYQHIGFAADTPFGLVVPVIRDADQKSVVEIAQELGELSSKARDKKLSPRDMQGGCFSVSSLGGIGGTAFTPIVNWPEVAILGVSRSSLQPVWNNQSFEPRLMLPLSLSYDHRVIDGADAARFTRYLAILLTDSRRMLL